MFEQAGRNNEMRYRTDLEAYIFKKILNNKVYETATFLTECLVLKLEEHS